MAFATSLILSEWIFCFLGLPTAYLVPAPLVFCSFIYYSFYFLVFALIHRDFKFLFKDNCTTWWRCTVVIATFAHCVLITLAYVNINHFFVKRKLKISSSYLESCDIGLLIVITSCVTEHSSAVTLHLLQCLPISNLHSFPGFRWQLVYELSFCMNGSIQHLAFFAWFHLTLSPALPFTWLQITGLHAF